MKNNVFNLLNPFSISSGASRPSFYVSTTGNDSNPGTFTQPWLTLDHALSTATPKSNVYLRGGTYYLGSQITKSNLSGLVIQNYTGETPVISGGVAITGWVTDTGSIQKVTGVTTSTRNLWVNGTRCTRASHTGDFSTAGVSSSGYTFAGNDDPVAAYARPQDLEIVGKYSNYIHARLPVSSASASLITMTAPAWSNASNWLANAAGGSNDYSRLLHIKSYENAYELMGTGGQFYRNGGTNVLYYTPRSGTHPSHTGTLNGSPAWVVDAPSALSGQTNCINFAGGASKNVQTTYPGVQNAGARTFSAWVKDGTGGDILSYGTVSTLKDFEWAPTSATKLGVFCNGGNIVYNCPSLNDGSWHHIALVIPLGANFNQMLFYVDGILLSSKSSGGGTGTLSTLTGDNLMIGNYHSGGGAGFSGKICDVRVFETDLTASQVSTLAAGGTVSTAMYGNWKLNEGSGTTAADSWAGNGENLSSAICVIGNVTTLLDLTSCSNITFKGITFSHTTWSLGNTGYIGQNPSYTVLASDASQGDNADNLAVIPGAIQVHGGTVTFDGCTFSHLGTAGINFDTATSSPVVKNGCVFSDLSGPAITIGGEVSSPFSTPPPTSPAVNFGALIQDFYMYSCCQEYETESPLALSYTASGTTIQNGEIAQCPYIAVGMNGLAGNNLAYGVSITNLLIHDTMTDSAMTDGAAIHLNGYTSLDGTSVGGMSITGNVIWKANSPTVGGPFYLDDITKGVTITGNVTSDPDASGTAVHFNNTGGGNNIITNNYFANLNAISSIRDTVSPNTYSTTPQPSILSAAGISSAYQSVNRNSVDDTFSYADGTDLTTQGWTLWGQGPFTAQSGKASITGDFGVVVRDKGNISQVVTVTFTYSNSSRLPAIIGRGIDPNNFVYVGVKDSTHLGIWTNTSGSLSSSLKTIAATLNTNTSYTLKVYFLGTSMFVYLDGTYLDRYDSLSSTFNTSTATFCGIGVVTGGGTGTCTFTNFTVGSPN